MQIQRSFIIGDNWLYYKIYSGPKTAEIILTEHLSPVLAEFIVEKRISQWHFVRYLDPNPHLRIRFLITQKADIHHVILNMFEEMKPLVEQGLIWKLQMDTYNRELERYGKNTIELSEAFFYHDSEATLRFLFLIDGDKGEELRWLYSLRLIDTILSAFKFQPLDKLLLIEELKTGFGREFNMSRPLKKQLDRKYREKRSMIEEFMSFRVHDQYGPILDIYKRFSARFTPIAGKILDIKKNNLLEPNINDLIGSYIHMSMNRLFKSKNRLNEMVCYDFLFRYYKSFISRYRKALNQP